MSVLAALGVSLVLATLVESMVEYLFGVLFDHLPAWDKFRWTLMYLALGVGVGLAFFYKLDLISWIAKEAGWELAASWVGIVLTGLVIGRGANYMHQFISKWFPARKPTGAE